MAPERPRLDVLGGQAPWNSLTRMPEVLAVCGRPGLLERPIDLGRMVHLARMVGNAPWVRRMLARMTFGRALAVHCHEEMSTLAGFLPDLYASELRSHSG